MASTRERPRSAAQWAELLAEWRRSGLSLRGFAARVGVHHAGLSYWKRKLEDDPPPADATAAPTFVPVTLAAAPTPTAARGADFEVATPAGWRVRVPPDFDAAALARLLGVLRGAAC